MRESKRYTHRRYEPDPVRHMSVNDPSSRGMAHNHRSSRARVEDQVEMAEMAAVSLRRAQMVVDVALPLIETVPRSRYRSGA